MKGKPATQNEQFIYIQMYILCITLIILTDFPVILIY